MKNIVGRRVIPFGLAGILLAVSSAEAAPMLFNDHANFAAAIDVSVVDDYSNAAYTAGDIWNFDDWDWFSNAAMSAVLGETNYETTGHLNANMVQNQMTDAFYCSGCNGSFRLTFTSTSVGTPQGVFAVGLTLHNTLHAPFHAFVTFGDSSTADYVLPGALYPVSAFWGIASGSLITSIHFGLANGGTTTDEIFAIDDLEIAGAPDSSPTGVPEPASLTLLSVGLWWLGALRRGQKRA